MNGKIFRNRIQSKPWAPILAAILGAAWYGFLLIRYSQTQESVLDEGAYLFKGLLFMRGQYTPYQLYGVWTNHMPLAFLIPGFVQYFFGPGILAGRSFAILLALLTLLGIWLLASRLTNRWLAAAAVWVVALNPMLSKMYATAIPQGIVIFMLTWMLVLVLGPNRALWKTTLAGFIAGLIFMTRINMFLVLPIVVLYIFWEHGRKAGILAGLSGGLVVIIGHAIYWPGILQLWTILPRSLTPFLSTWRLPAGYDSNWDPNTGLEGRLLSFFQIFRFHFVIMTGGIVSWLLWPGRDRWRSKSDFRSAVFLSALFLILLSLHLWFSVGGDYCVFCMPGYFGFFFVLGLFLIILTINHWRASPGGLRSLLCALVVLLISAGVGYSAFETIGQPLVDLSIPSWLVGSAGSAPVRLGAVLVNKLRLEEKLLRRILPVFFGFGAGLLILLAAFLSQKIFFQNANKQTSAPSYGYMSMIIFLIVGGFLTPTVLLSGGYSTYDCKGNVLESYRATGEHLSQLIPPGSLVYWKGTLSAVPLLYLKGVRIFPPQINDGYSYVKIGDDLDEIQRLGRWNDTLSVRWAHQADFVLIEQRSFFGWLKDLIQNGDYEELPSTPRAAPCRENSVIRVFRNNASTK